MSNAPAEAPGPYAAWAQRYLDAGWTGVLPLPLRAKTPPPGGYTGATGAPVSANDVGLWRRIRGNGNIALRMPETVIGLDVDAYGDKLGAITMELAAGRLGELPSTWRTTSRADGVSGIRLYRVPPGLAWPGELGGGVEIIQARHRYAVAPPSVHPEGRVYRWLDPHGNPCAAPPRIDDLPELPQAWVDGLTGGRRAVEVARAATNASDTMTYLSARERSSKPPCERMNAVLPAMRQAMGAGSAHAAARTASLSILRLGDDGHAGALVALESCWRAFCDEVTNDRHGGAVRSEWEAQAEWTGLVTSAMGLVLPEAVDMPICDCDFERFAEWFCGPGAPALRAQSIAEAAQQASGEQGSTVAPENGEAGEAPRAPRLGATWGEMDLTEAVTGVRTSPEPEALVRADGVAMWYPGRINGLLGESESGKTWVALVALRQMVQRGQRVTMLDFEDSADGFVDRLKILGLGDEEILSHVSYVSPAEAFSIHSQVALSEHLASWEPDLVVVDGFNAGMTLMGLDLLSNHDATKFFLDLLNPIAATGAVVVYIDHVPKNRDKDDPSRGGIGAQAKRAMTTGCTLTAEVRVPFARGKAGQIDLYVDKDRTGYVREHAVNARLGQWVGTVLIDSSEEDGMDALFSAPAGVELPEKVAEREERVDKDIEMAADIFDYLHGQTEPPTTRGVRSAVHGRNLDIRRVLDRLIENELVVTLPYRGGRGTLYALAQGATREAVLQAFGQGEEDAPDVVPNGSEVAPGTTGTTESERGVDKNPRGVLNYNGSNEREPFSHLDEKPRCGGTGFPAEGRRNLDTPLPDSQKFLERHTPAREDNFLPGTNAGYHHENASPPHHRAKNVTAGSAPAGPAAPPGLEPPEERRQRETREKQPQVPGPPGLRPGTEGPAEAIENVGPNGGSAPAGPAAPPGLEPPQEKVCKSCGALDPARRPGGQCGECLGRLDGRSWGTSGGDARGTI